MNLKDQLSVFLYDIGMSRLDSPERYRLQPLGVERKTVFARFFFLTLSSQARNKWSFVLSSETKPLRGMPLRHSFGDI